MKIPATLLGLLGLLLLVAQLRATPLTGDSVNIGTDNNVPTSSYSAAFGANLYFPAGTTNSMLIGDSLNTSYGSLNSLIVGHQMSAHHAENSLWVGMYNTSDGGVSNSLLVGDYNAVSMVSGAVMGSNNAINGQFQFAIGRGLVSDGNLNNASGESTPAIFLGQYNRFDASLLLTVGNGAGAAANQRANAFEVYLDGKIKAYNAMEIFAPGYNPANVNSGKIVIQPAVAGSIITIDGQPVLTSSSAGGAFNINPNGQATVATAVGQPMFLGRQIGSTYSYPAGIFQAITDNAYGAANYYFQGITGGPSGTTNFSVRADGTAYFAGNVGIGIANPNVKLDVISNDNSDTGGALRTYANNLTQNATYSWGGVTSTYYYKILSGNNQNISLTPGGTGNTIITNGSVGIGTGTPGSKLTVKNGNVGVENGDIGVETNHKIALSNNEDPFSYITSDYSNQFGYGLGTVVFGSPTTAFAFANGEDNEIGMILKEGKLGVGTFSPRNGLEIATQDASGAATLRVGGIWPGSLHVALGAETSRNQILFSTWRDAVPDAIGAKIVAINRNAYTQNNALVQSTDLAFFTGMGAWNGSDSTGQRMLIQSDGQVVINNSLTLLDPAYNPSNVNAGKIIIRPSVNGSSISIDGQSILTAGSIGNISFGDSGSILNPSWKGGESIGNNTYDKVVLGPLSSTYIGATIGAHNSALNAWANLNLSGQNLIFRTNGETEMARMTSSGNFGIGTASPAYKLDVAGNSNHSGQAFFSYGNTAAAGYSWTNSALTTNSIEIVNNNGVVSNSSPTLAFHRYGSGGPQFRLDAGGSNVLYLESAGANSARNPSPYGGSSNSWFSRLHVDGALTTTGNVGVGTTNPQAKLDVNGSVRFGEAWFNVNESPDAFVVYNGADGAPQLRVDGDQKMVLLQENANSGRVGIGTASPQALLDVHGDAVLGVGLAANQSTPNTGQVVVGKYNDTRTSDTSTTPSATNHTQGVFIVAAGNSATRANAIRVLDDGTVLVKPSGDIAMGSFTNGPKP